MTSNDDEAWRAIVDNYGERPRLDDEETRAQADPGSQPREPLYDAETRQDDGGGTGADWDPDWSTDRFVPPPPPPVPRTTTDRYLAWLGVVGSPAVLLVCLVLGVDLPQWLGYALVAAFVVGFCYLVVRMPRGRRDPGDDGAVL